MKIERYKALRPDAQLKGDSFLTLIKNMNREQVEGIFREFGYEEDQIDPDGWYPVQDYCNILKKAEEKIGTNVLTAVGMAIMDTGTFPDQVKGIPDILASFEPVYYAAHKNSEPTEGWRVEFPSENEVIIRASNPYPMNLNYGLVWGATRRYCPEGYTFDVKVVETLEDNQQHDEFKVTWYPE